MTAGNCVRYTQLQCRCPQKRAHALVPKFVWAQVPLVVVVVVEAVMEVVVDVPLNTMCTLREPTR